MIEVRRDLYIDEKTGLPSSVFSEVSKKIRNALIHSLINWNDE